MDMPETAQALTEDQAEERLRLGLIVDLDAGFAELVRHHERVGTAVEDLRARGHEVVVDADWSLGRVSAAGRENGLLKAGANPRGMQGYAVGR